MRPLVPTVVRDAWMLATRMRPSVFVAGFQKCGTTSLYNYLAQIPPFVPGRQKETYLLSAARFHLPDYLAFFPFRRPGRTTLCGSHQITFVPGSIERLKRHFPDARVVVIMRDPVRRAYSHYQHNVRTAEGRMVPGFAESVARERALLAQLPDLDDITGIFDRTGAGPTADGERRPRHARFGMYLSRGLYYNYLRIMRDLGIDFLPLCTEILQQDFDREFRGLLDFLDVPAPARLPEPERWNRGDYDRVIDDELLRSLYDFFRPHNQKLYQLLGRDYGWERHAPGAAAAAGRVR